MSEDISSLQPVMPAVQDDASVNVINPENQLVSIPQSQLQEALSTGYTQATPEEIANYAREQKYGNTKQQIITGLEGAGEAATFGLSTGLERMAGVNPEDIQGRRETNPGTHMAGQVAGLAASSLIPVVGEANVLSKSGRVAAEAIGLGAEGAGALSRIGSGAVKLGVENMMFQAGDEVSKMLASDPNQSVETALANIGLSGLIGGGIGGAIGSISPLWKATMGGKTSSVLKAIADKAGGIEGALPDEVTSALQRSGIDIAPEIRASLSEDPTVRSMFQTLQESSTKSGEQAQQALKAFKNQVSEQIVTSLGKTPEELGSLVNMSEHDIGEGFKNSLIKSLKDQIDPISEQFEKIRGQYEGIAILPTSRDKIATEIGNMAQKEGFHLSPSSAQAKEIDKVLTELPNLKTLEDVRKYQSIIRDNTSVPELYRVGKMLNGILRTAEEDTMLAAAVKEGPDALLNHSTARSAYRNAMELIDSLNDRLHVGRYNGPGTFMKALQEMSPEDIARRLGAKRDADLLGMLQEKFPETAQQVKEYHIQTLLKPSVQRATEGQVLSNKAFFNAVDKMSPELKRFALGDTKKIDSLRVLTDALPSKMNTSGTAKTLDSLWKKIPGSAIGMATMLSGHNPVMGVLLGALTNFINREAPDAVKLSVLKFLGSSKALEIDGFKAMADFIHHTIKGENLISKATKSVFKAGAEVLPQSQMPDQKDRDRLDKSLKSLQADITPLFEVGGKTAHYLPDQGTSMGQVASNAVNYLNGLRPNTDPKNPLDTPRKADPVAQARYDRALNIAEQPLIVMKHIQDGTLTSNDIITLKTIYPNLYDRLSQKLMANMTDAVAKESVIPYKTRLGLSLFLGQPLDATMTPQSIQSAQPVTQQQNQNQPSPRHSMASLSKVSQSNATPSQAREMAKLGQKA